MAKAYAAYKKRLGETDRPLELAVNIHMAVIEYAEFCKATDRFVMLPATFFGPDRHFVNNWSVPTEAKLPKNNDDLCGFASTNGLRQPYAGESYPAYRTALEQLIT